MKNKLLILGLSLLTLTFTSCSCSNPKPSSNSPTRVTDELFSFLQEHYYLDVEDRELIDGMISGLTSSFQDPFTYYTSAARGEEQDYTTSGVGLGFSRSLYYGEALIDQVMKNSPCERAGLKEQDIIYQIRNINPDSSKGEMFVLKENPYATWNKAFSGVKNSQIELFVKRMNNEGVYEKLVDPIVVTRNAYNVDKVQLMDFTSTPSKSEAYVKITSFLGDKNHQETTPQDELKEVFDHQIFNQVETLDHLIIDLRGNGGGYVDNCVSTLGLFIPKNEVTAYYEYKNGNVKALVNTNQDKQYTNKIDEITIVVDEKTASAGESFALGLRDSQFTKNKVKIAGQVSFGKGIAQTFIGVFDDGSLIRYTFAKVLSPSKECINKRGIVPDTFLGIEEIPYDQLRREIRGVSNNDELNLHDQEVIKYRIEKVMNTSFDSLSKALLAFRNSTKLNKNNELIDTYDQACANKLSDLVFDRIIVNYNYNVYNGYVAGVTNNDDLTSVQRKFIKDKVNTLMGTTYHSFDLAIQAFQKANQLENEEHIYNMETSYLLHGLLMDEYHRLYQGVIESLRK